MSQHILIAYYSHSGNTARVAKALAQLTGGDLYPIEPVQAYPTNYQTVLSQSESEIRRGYRPPLKKSPLHASGYEIIFVGSPNWYSNIAPPVASFLEQANLAGKTVIPFITHGGGGAVQPFRVIQKLCAGASVLSGFDVYGSGGAHLQADLATWIKRLCIPD